MAEADPIGKSDFIRQNRSIPTGAIDGELMALDPARGEVYGLDPTGTAIWNAIGDGIRVDDLIASLVERFDVAPERCEAETLAFLAELRDAGMLVVEPTR